MPLLLSSRKSTWAVQDLVRVASSPLEVRREPHGSQKEGCNCWEEKKKKRRIENR